MYGSIISSYLGYSITIQLPSNWYNSKWIGFALWTSLSDDLGWKSGIRAHLTAYIHQNHCASELFATLISFEVNICLFYLSRDDWSAKFGNGECNRINVIFEIDTRTQNVTYQKKRAQYVGESGVSLIYKQDVNEFNQTNVQCLIESFGKEVCIYKLTGNDNLSHPINGQSYSVLFSF